MTGGNPGNLFASPFGLGNRLLRALWGLAWLIFFRPSPRVFHAWRRWLLRLFGAKVESGVRIYPSVKVWAPWKLHLKEHCCLGPQVDCYNVAGLKVGCYSVVSQYTYLCGASHDYRKKSLPLLAKPIVIGDWVWVAADVFVGPGVVIGDGSVIGARSGVYRDVQPWTVAAGNPARVLKQRELSE